MIKCHAGTMCTGRIDGCKNCFMEDKMEERQRYIEYLEKKHNRKIKSLDIDYDGDYVDLHYTFEPVGFERIRRITGYLVGSLESWNDAKRAEEKDRVKHK